MLDAFAVLCCFIGGLFLFGAWKLLISRHEPEIKSQPITWADILMELLTGGSWIEFTVLDRFTSVLVLFLIGMFFLWGGLYIGLAWGDVVVV
jgi:hypothetical protein